MKRLMLVMAVTIFAIPVLGLMSPAYAQFDSDVDLSGLLNGGGGTGNRGNQNRGPAIPVRDEMFKEIQDTLKKGKTPLLNSQEKPVKDLLGTEIVALTDRVQLLRNNQNNPNGLPQGEQGGGRGGRGGGQPQANNAQQNQQQSEQAIKVETITSLRNEDFLNTKLAGFLTPEQMAVVQKAHAEDKANSNCLGGLLDRYYQQMNSRGNQNQNQNQNFNNNNNQTRPNGQKYCMAVQATPSERLEPIRKVLAKANMPLAKDKEIFAETFMKAELQDLETALRTGLTTNNNQGGGRGGNNNQNNRNNNPQQIIQSSIDGMYKKVEAMLNPDQATTLKTWHYTQMLGRSPVESLIAVNAMWDTPLNDEQIAKLTVAWPEYRNQIQQKAKQAGQQLDAKTIDKAAMKMTLDSGILEPSQVVSYQMSVKYGPEAAANAK